MSEWISVKERLPEKGQFVLIICAGSSIPISASYEPGEYYEWDENCNCGGYGSEKHFYQNEITHWMPLPEVPNE